MSNSHHITILLVEDNAGHAHLIKKNLRRSGIANEIVALSDGQQAVDYLFSEGDYEGQAFPTPLMILLDLNLPVLSGYQVLQRIKQDERTRRIPVVMLTSTDDPREVTKCYDLGCSIYLTKPVEYSEFSEAVRKLGLFLSVVTIPNEAY